uniref:hypothetical protein n=1 Tax=Pseudomonas aeruginosa TaxID=287 RepID=UPI001ED99832
RGGGGARDVPAVAESGSREPSVQPGAVIRLLSLTCHSVGGAAFGLREAAWGRGAGFAGIFC